MTYAITPGELEVLLELLVERRYSLTPTQLTRLGDDPARLPRDLLDAPVASVRVSLAALKHA